MTSWGPRVRVERIHDKAGVLQNNNVSTGAECTARRERLRRTCRCKRDLERYESINFHPRELSSAAAWT